MRTIRPELLDELLADYEKPDDLLGEDGLFKQLKAVLLERALDAELSDHLGYEKGDPAGRGTGNSRNGYSDKTVLSEDGEIDIAVPRDRTGTFDPLIVPKGERRLEGFDDRIVSLYARGMTVREIRGHLQELYGVAVSPDLISRVTDAVLEEVREWQNRPLDAVYPVVFFDALRVKIRDEGLVRNKAVYVALALTAEGEKEVLGLWIEQTEGAKFWLKVMNDLKTRGVADILIAVVDGLKGFPEAITTVFPETTVQTCIVHLIRSSLAFVSWKDRKRIMPDIKAIYRAETAETAAACLSQRLWDRLKGFHKGVFLAHHGDAKGTKMRQKSMSSRDAAEQTVRDIRRRTRKQYSAEEKIRIVLSGLRGEDSIAELCRREGDRREPLLQLVEGVPRGWQETAFGRYRTPGVLG